jgi:hypothetical protein
MKKLTTISLILAGSIFADGADDLTSAFKEGKWEGRVRAQYFSTDWNDNSITGKNGKDAIGVAIGGSILYKTAPLYGFTLGSGLYTTQNAFNLTDPKDGATATTSKDLFSRDIGSQYGDGYAVLAQMYLGYDFARTKSKAGRFLITNPWITPNDTKMIPIAVEGIEFVSNDAANSTIQFDYVNKIKERGESTFDNMTTTGDTPSKIAQYYLAHNAPSVAVLGATNKSIDGLELQVWAMNWSGIVNQARVEANYAFELGDAIVGVGGRYMQQFDDGAGDMIKPKTNNFDNNEKVDTSLYALRTTINYGDARVLLSHSKTSSKGDFIAPWRGFPTDGYTRSMTQTDWNANTKAYKAGLEYDFDDIVSGMSANLSYSIYDRDESKKPYSSATDRAFQNGDTTQWNLDVTQKLVGGFSGVELKARFMLQDNDTTLLYAKDSSNREMRLETNYRF